MPNIAVSCNTDDAKDVSSIIVFLSKFLGDTVTPIAELVKAEVKPEPEPQASMVFRQNDKPIPITPPPVETVVTPPPPAQASSVDKDGHPWDARIHADSKTKTDSGFWRRRRNLTDEFYDSVIAELKGTRPVILPPPATPAPTASVAPAIPPGPVSEPVTFASLTTRLGAAVTAGKLTHEQVMQILGNHGVVGLKGLLSAQGVYASVSAELDALLALS